MPTPTARRPSHLESGVGQGCPAAAVLFVVGINPLLVALEKRIEKANGEALSAYADDIAVVFSELSHSAAIGDEFDKLRRSSALTLNMRRTALVPGAASSRAPTEQLNEAQRAGELHSMHKTS